MALAAGLLIQAGLAFAPDPGLGPPSSGLPALRSTPSEALSIVAANLLTLLLLTAGGLLTGMTALSRSEGHPRRRLLVYFGVLAAAAWVYFVAGVDRLAVDLDLSRPELALRLVHGYLEWPALLLPWAAVAFAVTPRRTLDLRFLAAACACSVALLVGAAIIETFMVPDLIGASA